MKIADTARLALAIALAGGLVACGGKRGNGGADGRDAAGAAADTAAAPSAQAGADLSCPAKVREGLPGPDIDGLKLGMSLDEALATARCALGADAPVQTEKDWLDHLNTYGVQLGTQSFTIKQGEHRPCNYAREWQSCEGSQKWEHVDDAIIVATPGAPGKETAMAIWRTQKFREGRMPAVQATIDALSAKYGKPQIVDRSDSPNGYTAGYRRLQWVFDRNGNPLTDPNPQFRECANAIYGSVGGETSASWRDGCGLDIVAKIDLSGANPGLAMQLDVAMLQQSRLYAHAQATQAELQRIGEARRAEEVKQAGDANDVHL